MEDLPVEVIGNILSHLRAARDVVVASATCKKWREAFQYHLQSLTFHDDDWPVYGDDPTSNWPIYGHPTPDKLKIIITQTILQTKGLRCLSVFLSDMTFTTDDVRPWLMHAGDTLRELYLDVWILPSVKILEKCNGQKLEVLELAHIYMCSESCKYQKFPFLKTLRLEDVDVKPLDLRTLLTLCPKIENLTLLRPRIGPVETMELNTNSMKTIHVAGITAGIFILEADSLEYLHLQMCKFEHFEFVGKGALKVLNLDVARIKYFEIRDNMENLEIVDVNDSTIEMPKLYLMISRSSNLRRLRLWHVKFDNVDEVIDLERISFLFPMLTHLSLYYEEEETLFSLQVSSQLQNVVVLELGCVIYYHLTDRIAGILRRCPNLKKIVIHGKILQDLEILAQFSSSIIQLARKYLQVEFQFNYE
ncbi:hypothetical protein SLA2020_352750 [Shorea laevis]